MCRVWESMTGNLFTCEISGRVRVSAHVPPTGRFPNCLVSRLTVCLRDERSVARNFQTHDHRRRNTYYAPCLRIATARIARIVRGSGIFFFSLYHPDGPSRRPRNLTERWIHRERSLKKYVYMRCRKISGLSTSLTLEYPKRWFRLLFHYLYIKFVFFYELLI